MTIKDQIGRLLSAIDAQGGPENEKEIIGIMVSSATKYIDIILKQGLADQRGLAKDRLVSVDYDRTRTLSSLISEIDTVILLCHKYGLEPLYQGPDERRAKGDWALQLITDYYLTRA